MGVFSGSSFYVHHILLCYDLLLGGDTVRKMFHTLVCYFCEDIDIWIATANSPSA